MVTRRRSRRLGRAAQVPLTDTADANVFHAAWRAHTLCARRVNGQSAFTCPARSVGLRLLMLGSRVGRCTSCCYEPSEPVKSFVDDGDTMFVALASDSCVTTCPGPRSSLLPRRSVFTSWRLRTLSLGPCKASASFPSSALVCMPKAAASRLIWSMSMGAGAVSLGSSCRSGSAHRWSPDQVGTPVFDPGDHAGIQGVRLAHNPVGNSLPLSAPVINVRYGMYCCAGAFWLDVTEWALRTVRVVVASCLLSHVTRLMSLKKQCWTCSAFLRRLLTSASIVPTSNCNTAVNTSFAADSRVRALFSASHEHCVCVFVHWCTCVPCYTSRAVHMTVREDEIWLLAQCACLPWCAEVRSTFSRKETLPVALAR